MSRPATAFAPAVPAADEHAAFFAAIRAELDETRTHHRIVVPRSFKAALLAGLVVGCALAGFNVAHEPTQAEPSPLATVAAALGAPIATNPFGNLAPATMLLGLLSGARIAATTMIVLNRLLTWADLSSRAAYTFGGALVSAALAALLAFGLGHQPAHGWAVEIAAGAGAGFLYRVFAGRKLA